MIHVTEKARRKKIRELLAKGRRPRRIRADCASACRAAAAPGLSYAMRLDTQARDRDKVFEENGARIFVDPKSFLYLNDTTLEYEEDSDAPGIRLSES